MLKLPKQIKMGREKPLIEPLQVDTHRHLTPPNPKSSQQDLLGFVNRAIGPCTEDQDYIEKIKQLQAYLDMVKKIVKPGCSQEVLKVALSSMTSLSSDFQATRVYEAKEIITLTEG